MSYQGQQYLPNSQEYTDALTELVTKICGFVYAGDKQAAILDTIRVLRDHPALAALLLSTEDNVLVSTGEDDDVAGDNAVR